MRTTPPSSPDFSPVRAWRHVQALTRIGPRVPGTRGSRRARAYLRTQLERLGAEVYERRAQLELPHSQGSVSVVHLTGVLEGDSDDLLMLAAPYDTAPVEGARFVGANDGASGPAMVLEIGRVLSQQPRPHTVWLTFIDGDAALQEPAAVESARLGSRSLVAQLAADERLEDIRLAVIFNQVCDPQLTIARDLRSHVIHREAFWNSAAELGAGDAFTRGDGFESPPGPHLSFLEHDMRRVVAIVDDRLGGDGPPGVLWRSEGDSLDNCAASSLETVGLVTHAALRRISSRLTKVDGFAARESGNASLAEGAQPAAPQDEGSAAPAQASPEAVSPPAQHSSDP
jgi:hypothetical protein